VAVLSKPHTRNAIDRRDPVIAHKKCAEASPSTKTELKEKWTTNEQQRQQQRE
jgi:hypothetical protein